jgi:hypothetical protein
LDHTIDREVGCERDRESKRMGLAFGCGWVFSGMIFMSHCAFTGALYRDF